MGRLVCQSDHVWAHEVRGAILSAMVLMADGRALAAQLRDTATSMWDTAFAVCGAWVWPLLGWCPFRDEADALARCSHRTEMERVRMAADCVALRRAFHEGQKLLHPDHLRVKHPRCADRVLEAC